MGKIAVAAVAGSLPCASGICLYTFFRGVFIMKKFVAFIFALVLCLSMTITAFATDYDSPGGGDNTEETASPQTGSAAVVLLAGAACAAGGISAVSFKKSR